MPVNDGIVLAEPDLDIRKGTEMDDERPLISTAEVIATQKAGNGQSLARYAVVMRAPDDRGNPGAGNVVKMPADLFQKWYGQGYRGTNGVTDHTLFVYPKHQPVTRWLPSMIEEAITRGEAIPEDMCPPGYYGPTFVPPKRKRQIQVAPEGIDLED